MAIGRNDKCSCGSGKKYKNCCLIKEQLEKEKELAEKKLALLNEENSQLKQEQKTLLQEEQNLLQKISNLEKKDDDGLDTSLPEEMNDWYKEFRKIEDNETMIASFESLLENHTDWLPTLSGCYDIMGRIEKKIDTNEMLPLIEKWDNLFPHFQSESKYYYYSLLKEKYCNGLDYSKYLNYHIDNADDEADNAFSLFHFFLTADDLAVAIPFAEKVVRQFNDLEWQFELYAPVFYGNVLKHIDEPEETFVESALSLAAEHSSISWLPDYIATPSFWVEYYQMIHRDTWPEMKERKTTKYQEQRMKFYAQFCTAFIRYLVHETKMSTALANYTSDLVFTYNRMVFITAKSPLFDLSRNMIDKTLPSIAQEFLFNYNLGILNAAASGLYHFAAFLGLHGYYNTVVAKKIQQDVLSLYEGSIAEEGSPELKMFGKLNVQ